MSGELPGCSCFVVSWHGVEPATKTPLLRTGLSMRSRKAALRLGVHYIEELSRFTRSAILLFKYGDRIADEIELELRARGLSFASETNP